MTRVIEAAWPFVAVLLAGLGCGQANQVGDTGPTDPVNTSRILDQRFLVDDGTHIYDVDLRTRTRRLFVPEQALMPTWSQDGSRIAYVAGRDIWVINPDGTGRGRITSAQPGDAYFKPYWSPAAVEIVAVKQVNVGGGQLRGDLYIIDMATGRQSYLTEGAQPVWSPDGQTIAFIKGDELSHNQIFTISPDGTNLLQRTTRTDTPNYPDHNVPSWSPSGLQLAFWSGHEACIGDIWVYDAAFIHRTRLTDAYNGAAYTQGVSCFQQNPAVGANSDNPKWAPDGVHFVFETLRGNGPESRLVNVPATLASGADASHEHVLLPFLMGASSLVWQPFGS